MQLGIRSVTSAYMAKTFEDTGRLAPLYGRAEQVNGMAAICAALEAAGVVFTDGDKPSVKLRKAETA